MFGCTFYFCFAVQLPVDNWHFVNNAILMIYFQNVSPVFEITRARSYLSVSWLTGYLTVIITFSRCLVRVIGCFMFFSLSTCKQVLRERLLEHIICISSFAYRGTPTQFQVIQLVASGLETI